MPTLSIGLDLDNTIIDYSDIALRTALSLSLVPPGFKAGKRGLRNALRSLPDGDRQWQRVQAEIYGPRIAQAAAFPGVLDFLRFCAQAGIRTVIVSHKTEFAAATPQGVNLRDAALGWLRSHEVTGDCGIAEPDVHFVSTRSEKLAQIAAAGCAIFIDDLIEVFAEIEFPSGVARWLFAPDGEEAGVPGVRVFRTWYALREALAHVANHTQA